MKIKVYDGDAEYELNVDSKLSGKIVNLSNTILNHYKTTKSQLTSTFLQSVNKYNSYDIIIDDGAIVGDAVVSVRYQYGDKYKVEKLVNISMSQGILQKILKNGKEKASIKNLITLQTSQIVEILNSAISDEIIKSIKCHISKYGVECVVNIIKN